MKFTKFCKNCRAGIKAGREDRAFCDDKCAAAYHRGGTPDYAHEGKIPGNEHEQKARTKTANCQYCGQEFVYNEYAARGGQRVPQYHSNVCRQAAYRARKAGRNTPYEDKQQQQQQQQDDQTWEYEQSHDWRQGKQQQQQQQNETRKNANNTWEDVLGVKYGSSWDVIEAAWRKLIGECHPDRNRENLEWATRRTQDINQAYQTLKKQHGKNRKQQRV